MAATRIFFQFTRG